MPNRIIRESLLDSDRYHGVPHDSERLLFLELLLLADDYGIVPMNFAFLRRRTTPCAGKSLDVVTAMVSSLADQDLIRIYRSEKGGQFAYIPRFGNSPRALKPKWPLPPDGLSSKEIKTLQEKRIANAMHRRADAPETETETETETEKKKEKLRAPRVASAPLAPPSNVPADVWNDFKALRARIRAPITATAMAGIEREALKAGLSLSDALRICCERSWRGFRADWLDNVRTHQGGATKEEIAALQREFEEREASRAN